MRPASISLGALAGALAVAALVPVDDARAATRLVTNCNDSGAGSLRNAIAIAEHGDNIDLIGLRCNRILLTSGELVVLQGSLTLLSRSRQALTIDANAKSRVINHLGTGTLRVYRLTVANGLVTDQYGYGGCIKSSGIAEVISSSVHHCRVIPGPGPGTAEPWSLGGAIVGESVLLAHSQVYSNLADRGYGGAVHAWYRLTLHYSQVFGNTATLAGGGLTGSRVAVTYSQVRDNVATTGGGIALFPTDPAARSLLLNKSTLSGNRATEWDGGITLRGPVYNAEIVDSTLSGNSGYAIGLGELPANTRIYNSTITLNEDRNDDCGGVIVGTGSLHMESTVVAGNVCTGGGAPTSPVCTITRPSPAGTTWLAVRERRFLRTPSSAKTRDFSRWATTADRRRRTWRSPTARCSIAATTRSTCSTTSADRGSREPMVHSPTSARSICRARPRRATASFRRRARV